MMTMMTINNDVYMTVISWAMIQGQKCKVLFPILPVLEGLYGTLDPDV